jgi:hypothetical protein
MMLIQAEPLGTAALRAANAADRTARKYSNVPAQPPAVTNRQHTQLAGVTAKRPAAPLVRDEEACGWPPLGWASWPNPRTP